MQLFCLWHTCCGDARTTLLVSLQPAALYNDFTLVSSTFFSHFENLVIQIELYVPNIGGGGADKER